MKYLWKGLLFVGLLALVGCGSLDAPAQDTVEGGKVVVEISPEDMRAILVSKKVIAADDKQTKVFGYKAYKIPYTTTDENDEEVAASGLMVVPLGLPEGTPLSVVSDDHGTIFANREAPTVYAEVIAGAPDGAPVILTAMAGFVTLQPDYIGFGDSNGQYHPYLLKKSLANATVDFIKAAKEFAVKNSIKLNDQLFITGYSEGGYAAMATLQKIEDEYLSEMPVTLAAPMAGPYSMSGMGLQVLSQPAISVPSFMANVGYAYAKTYGQDIDTVFNEPYASNLDTLFAGDLNRTQIDAQLTQKTTGSDGLFRQDFVNSFLSYQNWLLPALMQNDLYKWKAIAPVKLIHCLGDTIVPYPMAEITEGNMTTEGSTSVETVPVEIAITEDPATLWRLDHGECSSYAYKVAAGIFGGMRKARFGY